jgi:hypothetical protein
LPFDGAQLDAPEEAEVDEPPPEEHPASARAEMTATAAAVLMRNFMVLSNLFRWRPPIG